MALWTKDYVRIRSQSGLSMEKAAILMDITSRTLARYENGVNDVPMRIAEQMSKLYKVPFEEVRQAVMETQNETGMNIKQPSVVLVH